MDGLIYSNVAANMADGIGSFWHPTYTATHHPDFYQHPPLMFGLLALCYRVFGIHLWVTKLYMVLTTLLCAWLIVRLWLRMGGQRGHGWMPLALWTIIPIVPHFANQCMLENTMVLFDMEAILLLLRHGRKAMYGMLAGLLLAAAFLTKGFTGLFPLALPLLLWLFDRKNVSFKAMVQQTLCILVGLLLPLAVMALAVPQARDYFANYMELQVVAGWTQNEVPRWQIIIYFLRNTAPVIGIVVLVAILAHGLHHPNKEQLAMWTLVACAVLPMMVSTRQREFYLLTSMPLVAVLSASMLDGAKCIVDSIRLQALPVKIVAVALLTGAVTLNVMRFGTEGRDAELQRDMKTIVQRLDHGETASIPTPLYYDYKLQGYYYRESRITLDDRHQHRHMIATGEFDIDSSYHEIPLPTTKYKLYER